MNLLAFIFLALLGLLLPVTSGPPGYARVGGSNSSLATLATNELRYFLHPSHKVLQTWGLLLTRKQQVDRSPVIIQWHYKRRSAPRQKRICHGILLSIQPSFMTATVRTYTLAHSSEGRLQVPTRYLPTRPLFSTIVQSSR